MKKSKRKAEEEEILRKMFSDENISQSDEDRDASCVEQKRDAKKDDVIKCPSCGCVLPSRSACPRCGYTGYVPMAKSSTRRIKLILYPILLVIAVIAYLYSIGFFK